MSLDRRLIDYLPPFIADYREIKAIMEAEQITAEKVWTDAENTLADQFVQTATENGVKRYEKILSIVPKGTYTLDERRFQILARMNEQLPYTLNQLNEMLTALCGEDGYYLTLDTNAYELRVKLALYNEHNVQAVEELLYKVVPANIINKIMLFNTHLTISDFTHEQLSTHTYKGVREDVL
jgi:hypothetical protein